MKSTILNTLYAKRYTLCAILIALFCLILPQTAQAAEYYLDAVNGLDTNPGTSEAPWKTIQRALANSSSSPTVTFGDTVKLRNGDYGAVTISYSSPLGSSWDDKITYTADEGHSPVIQQVTFAYQAFYIELNNIKIRPLGDGAYGIYVKKSSSLRFIDLDCEGVWNTDYSDEIEQDPSGALALSGEMFYFKDISPDHTLMDDITIQGCTISKCSKGILVSCAVGDEDGIWTIRDNEIHTTSGSQIQLAPYNPGSNGHFLLKGNHIHDFYSFWYGGDMSHASGLSIRASNVTIEDNIIHSSGSTGGITFYSLTSPPAGWGGYFDIIIQNNLVYDISNYMAVRLQSVGDGSFIIRNNTIVGHQYSSGVGYYGNGLDIRPYGIAPDDGIDPSECLGLEIYNNVIVGRVSGPNLLSEDYNYFYSLAADGTYLTSHDHTFVATTSGYNNVFDSDFFVDTNFAPAMHRENLNDGYKLAAASPAIDFGDSTNAPPTDLLGNLRDAYPDAGCYEYGVSIFLYGDVSGEGEISAYDAALTAQAAVGLITLTPEQITAADVSGDGEVTAYDAALIAQRAVGLIEKFPVEG